MARPRPRPSRSTTRTRPRPSTPARPRPSNRARSPALTTAPLPWRRDPAIPPLTTEILRLQDRACTLTADTIVEIGRRLAAAKARLEHGEWLDWIASAMPFERSSADNYLALAKFADDDAREYERLRHLGPGKLYVVMKLPPERRRKLTLGRPLPVPAIDASRSRR